MNIAYLCTDFGIPVAGSKGASIHVRELSAALAALGHAVEIVTCRAGGETPADFDVPVTEIPPSAPEQLLADWMADDPEVSKSMAAALRSMLYLGTFRCQVLPLLKDLRPDAIYERYSLLGSAGVEIAAELDVPLILEVNAPLSEEHARHRGIAFAQTVRAAEQRILSSADQIIAVSEPLKQWIVATGVDERRVTVLPNGVDVDRFPAGAADVRRRRNPEDRPVVGFVGSLKAWHGTDSLIRAVGALCRQRGAADAPTLLIVGDGPQRAYLQLVAQEEGVDELTTFTGAVPHDQIPFYLGAMDIAVAPYGETADFYFSPLKVFEYMAAGRAIVAARIGQLKECIRDGETGLLYPPGDTAVLARCLEQLMDDAALSNRLGAAARREVETKHSWRQNAQAVVDLIEAAAGSRNGRLAGSLTTVGAS